MDDTAIYCGGMGGGTILVEGRELEVVEGTLQ